MKIGNVEIKGFAALAPMAGVADRAMREICMEHGAACKFEGDNSWGQKVGKVALLHRKGATYCLADFRL